MKKLLLCLTTLTLALSSTVASSHISNHGRCTPDDLTQLPGYFEFHCPNGDDLFNGHGEAESNNGQDWLVDEPGEYLRASMSGGGDVVITNDDNGSVDDIILGNGADELHDGANGSTDRDRVCDGSGPDFINVRDADNLDIIWHASDGDTDNISSNPGDIHRFVACPL